MKHFKINNKYKDGSKNRISETNKKSHNQINIKEKKNLKFSSAILQIGAIVSYTGFQKKKKITLWSQEFEVLK